MLFEKWNNAIFGEDNIYDILPLFEGRTEDAYEILFIMWKRIMFDARSTCLKYDT